MNSHNYQEVYYFFIVSKSYSNRFINNQQEMFISSSIFVKLVIKVI